MTEGLIEHGMLSATKSYRAVSELFSERSTLAMYMKVEKALARAQARAGVISDEAASAIEGACRADALDMHAWRTNTARVGYPIAPLVEQLASAAGDSGRDVHLGATTQDIMDTALVLQVREASALVFVNVLELCSQLRELTKRYRDTLMVGRSKLQHAAPITFGYKCAVWLDQIHRQFLVLQATCDRANVVQFGGAVGTLAALGSDAARVRELLALELELGIPDITWHVTRDRVADLVHGFFMINACLGKIAVDVAHMMSTEVGELHEPYAHGRGTSSTMPQKRNPVLSEAIQESALCAAAGTSRIAAFMLQDHERALGKGYLERSAIRQGLLYAAGASELAIELLSGLEVHIERMTHNLTLTDGLIMAESAMILLADKVGRHKSHHIVHDACVTSAKTGKSLKECLMENETLCAAELDAALDPARYLGMTDVMIDDVLKRTAQDVPA